MNNYVWEVVPRLEKKYVVTSNGSTRSSMPQMVALKNIRQYLSLEVSIRKKE